MIDTTQRRFDWQCQHTAEDTLIISTTSKETIAVEMEFGCAIDDETTPSIILSPNQADQLAHALTFLAARMRAPRSGSRGGS